ncbi:MAG: DUF2917 domain-containing protein [Burkholderiales bacterium]
MQINLNGTPIRLERGRIIAFDPLVRTRITAITGNLWITQDGNPRDYEIAIGETFAAPTSDRLVIQAETDSEFAIYEPVRASWLTRVFDAYGRFAASVSPEALQRRRFN